MSQFYKINDTDRIDVARLVGFLPMSPSWLGLSSSARTRRAYVKAMLSSWETLQRVEINTPRRLAHFFAQGLVETGWLQSREENLNYSSKALKATFRFYRNNPELARQHNRKPELIANAVYQNHLSLGNTEPGDGWRYRGRGFLQLTGRYNYEKYADVSGIDILNDPDIIVRDLKKSIEVAAAYWDHNKLNLYAEENDSQRVSRGVNCGDPEATWPAHSEDKREIWAARCLWLTESPHKILLGVGQVGDHVDRELVEHEPSPSDPPEPARPRTLRIGSHGRDVAELQESLNRLGFEAGRADGVFGQKTANALMAFQTVYGLTSDGIYGPNTHARLEQELSDPFREANRARGARVEGGYEVPPVASELAGAPDPFR